MKTLAGKINIYRPSGGDEVVVTIEDSGSGIQFVEFRLKLSDYARATTGQGDINGELTLRGLNTIGKIREHKRELVPVTQGDHKTREERGRKALMPFEVDGWKGRVEDTHNFHNQRGNGLYEVVFVRFVGASENISESA